MLSTNALLGPALILSVLSVPVGCISRHWPVRAIEERNFTNAIGMDMVYVDLIGLPTGLYVCKYETRQDHFELIMGYNPSAYRPVANKPVQLLRADEAMEFCARLTEYEQEKASLPAGYVYSLPTFNQWLRFFAGAPREGAIVGTSDASGDYDRSGNTPQPVHVGETNRLGIVNLYGNVQEFCLDINTTGYYAGEGEHRHIVEPGTGHINAGTSFGQHRKYFQQPTIRGSYMKASDRSFDTGFRCVLVKSGKSISDITGDSPLHRAAARGDLERVKTLIAGGAALDAKNKWGDTPLHRAAIWGHFDVTKTLVSAGANVNAKGKFGYTPTHHAILGGHPQTALYLLGAGADVLAMNVYGESLLYLAAEQGHTSLVRTLLSRGVTVDTRTIDGYTPLFIASSKGHKEIVEALLRYQKDLQ